MTRPPFVLVHGGLYEDMDADRFWRGPGLIEELMRRGVEVVAPNRLSRPTSWVEDAGHLMGGFETLFSEPTVHQHRTVEQLLRLIPGSAALPSSPEPVVSGFDAERFVDCVLDFVDLPLTDSGR